MPKGKPSENIDGGKRIDNIERELIGVLTKSGEAKNTRDIKEIIERLSKTPELRGERMMPQQRLEKPSMPVYL